MPPSTPTLLFVVNAPEFFLSHRLPIAEAAKQKGYVVHVATADGEDVKLIERAGFRHHAVSFDRSGQNPFRELKAFLQLVSLLFRLKPDLIHLVTIKPVIYGGIASRIAGVKRAVFAISGLGTVFLANTQLARFRRWVVTHLYRVALRVKHRAVIFQNLDDRDTLVGLGALDLSSTRLIRGSGVRIEDCPYLPEPNGRPVVAMAARLLVDKGVREFVEASSLLRKRGVDVEMRIIGAPDPGNPTSVSFQELECWESSGEVELLGFRKDIAAQYAAANVVCLPSYREGLPKSLVEAAACGRAVVTTDVAGCKDAIVPGETGLLVPPRDASALAEAIESLVTDHSRRHQMGRKGRELAEQAFAIEKIVEQHLDIYNELINYD